MLTQWQGVDEWVFLFGIKLENFVEKWRCKPLHSSRFLQLYSMPSRLGWNSWWTPSVWCRRWKQTRCLWKLVCVRKLICRGNTEHHERTVVSVQYIPKEADKHCSSSRPSSLSSGFVISGLMRTLIWLMNCINDSGFDWKCI